MNNIPDQYNHALPPEVTDLLGKTRSDFDSKTFKNIYYYCQRLSNGTADKSFFLSRNCMGKEKRRKIQKTLQRMIKMGLIEKKKRGNRQRANTYRWIA